MAIATTRNVAFFDTTTGGYLSRLALDPPFPTPVDVTPLPGDLLGLRVAGFADEVRVITRAGIPVTTDPTATVPTELAPILLSATPDGGGLFFYDVPMGGEIAAGFSVYDVGGNLLRTVDKTALDVRATSSGVAAITSGHHAGRFALIDPDDDALIVFSLP